MRRELAGIDLIGSRKSGAIVSVLSNPISFGALLVVICFYYLFLLSNGTFQFFAPEMFGKAFGNMLIHLLHGEFTVDPEAIKSEAYSEAFTRNGKTYAYFGVFPALLRLVAMPFTDVTQAQLARLSCLTATVTFVALQLQMLLHVHNSLPGASQEPHLLAVMVAATVLSGPQLYTLAVAWIYHEPILWAAVMGAAFNLIIVRAVFAGGDLRGRDLAWMAILAGLSLLTRPTIGVALYVGTTLLILRAALRWPRRDDAARSISAKAANLPGFIWATAFGDRRTALPILILGAMAAMAGLINFERWGNPFTFVDLHYATYGKSQTNGLEVLSDYGEFNLGRLWIGALYYLTGIPWLLKTVSPFAEFLHARYQTIEAPPVTPLLTNPITLFFASTGLFRLWRKPELCSRSVGILRLTLIGHGCAVFLIFTAIALALRYRVDLAPFMTLAALVGYRWTSIAFAEATDVWRRRLRIAAAGSCFLGILCSHYLLLLYKVWSMGVPPDVRSALLPFSPLSPY
jgi:hypothetical protein